MSSTEAIEYIAGSEDNKCIDGFSACSKGVKFSQCSETTRNVMQFVVPAALGEPSQCETVFKGFPGSCDQSFGQLVSIYCPAPLVLSPGAIAGLAVGCAIIAALSVYFCRLSGQASALQRELDDAVVFGIGPATQSQSKKSKFHGVKWNSTYGGWDATYKSFYLGTFTTQEQAARRYDQVAVRKSRRGAPLPPLNFEREVQTRLSHARNGDRTSAPYQNRSSTMTDKNSEMMDMAPSELPVIIPQSSPWPGFLRESSSAGSRKLEDPHKERHIEELIRFYQKFNADHEGIEEHCVSLFDRYGFRGIARALQRKYGELPDGWDEEYNAQYSIARSIGLRNPISRARAMSRTTQQAIQQQIDQQNRFQVQPPPAAEKVLSEPEF